MRYLRELTTAKLVLWCYLTWYLYFATRYFEANLPLWCTSLGLSAIIGVALLLSVSGSPARLGFWPTFRLFLMPFCVSSFSALVKGRGFVLIFSPRPAENVTAAGLVAAVCAVVLAVKWAGRDSNRARARTRIFQNDGKEYE